MNHLALAVALLSVLPLKAAALSEFGGLEDAQRELQSAAAGATAGRREAPRRFAALVAHLRLGRSAWSADHGDVHVRQDAHGLPVYTPEVSGLLDARSYSADAQLAGETLKISARECGPTVFEGPRRLQTCTRRRYSVDARTGRIRDVWERREQMNALRDANLPASMASERTIAEFNPVWFHVMKYLGVGSADKLPGRLGGYGYGNTKRIPWGPGGEESFVSVAALNEPFIFGNRRLPGMVELLWKTKEHHARADGLHERETLMTFIAGLDGSLLQAVGTNTSALEIERPSIAPDREALDQIIARFAPLRP